MGRQVIVNHTSGPTGISIGIPSLETQHFGGDHVLISVKDFYNISERYLCRKPSQQ
jgi:hypothetical protein